MSWDSHGCLLEPFCIFFAYEHLQMHFSDVILVPANIFSPIFWVNFNNISLMKQKGFVQHLYQSYCTLLHLYETGNNSEVYTLGGNNEIGKELRE